jgi:SOS-response transcriptional repressor LexA
MSGMAARQKEMFQIICEYLKAKGYSPSVRDIASEAGVCRSTAAAHLDALKSKGYITWDRGVGRSIHPTNAQ